MSAIQAYLRQLEESNARKYGQALPVAYVTLAVADPMPGETTEDVVRDILRFEDLVKDTECVSR